MRVRGFGTAAYLVETGSDNAYLVDIEAGTCSCPDHRFRGGRCKHIRRVAIEITERSVAPPHHVDGACLTCGEGVFVPVDDPSPHYCERHTLGTGTPVRDRETGDELLVVATSSRRADEVRIGDHGRTVAAYPTNVEYDPADRVVSAVYPRSVRTTGTGPKPRTLRVYSFPQSRLEPVEA